MGQEQASGEFRGLVLLLKYKKFEQQYSDPSALILSKKALFLTLRTPENLFALKTLQLR
ncbi:hypothetical protein NYE80_11905 [Paenibacillus sp. FSL H7-0357]|uniref:hypothetical protein n=1 Tax=Paenibacillus sp. FSL H7-0357 TaxID=1536774 RepID=UPI0030CF7623